jgi:hypothetical protein
MDVIGFLCVSLCSSTVQHHVSLGNRRECACSEAGFSSQNGDRDWVVWYRRAAICCVFCGQKDSIRRILIAMGSVCRVKRFITGLNGGPEVAETTVKTLLCCRFRRTGKAMGQVYECWWRICREINVFFRHEYHMFCFISICDLFTDLSRIFNIVPIFIQRWEIQK